MGICPLSWSKTNEIQELKNLSYQEGYQQSIVDQKIRYLKKGEAKLEEIKDISGLQLPKLSNLINSSEGIILNSIKLKDLNKSFKEKAIISIMGPFKVGKSHILSNIIKRPVNVSATVNTKGERIYFHEDFNIIDTEGFNQPTDDNPYFKEELITSHAFAASDIVVLVFYRMNISDKPTLDNAMDALAQNRIPGLNVIHNVRDIKKKIELVKYAKDICTFLSLDKSSMAILKTEPRIVIEHKYKSKTTFHYFLGDDDPFSDLHAYNIQLYSYLENAYKMQNTGKKHISFIKGFRLALRNVLYKYFSFSSMIFIIDQNTIRVGLQNYSQRTLTHSTNSNMATYFYYHDNSHKTYFMFAIAQFFLNTCIVLDNTTIQIRGFRNNQEVVHNVQVPFIINNNDEDNVTFLGVNVQAEHYFQIKHAMGKADPLRSLIQLTHEMDSRGLTKFDMSPSEQLGDYLEYYIKSSPSEDERDMVDFNDSANVLNDGNFASTTQQHVESLKKTFVENSGHIKSSNSMSFNQESKNPFDEDEKMH